MKQFTKNKRSNVGQFDFLEFPKCKLWTEPEKLLRKQQGGENNGRRR